MRASGIACVVCVACVVRSASAGEPAVVVAPFAVPVAVPVAVVERPTVFYGVSRFVPGLPCATGSASAASTSTVAPAKPLAHDRDRAVVEPILRRRCAECHQGAAARGGFMLFDADGRLPEKLPRHRIVAAAGSPTSDVPGDEEPSMPPAGRERLTPDERAALRAWARLPKEFAY